MSVNGDEKPSVLHETALARLRQLSAHEAGHTLLTSRVPTRRALSRTWRASPVWCVWDHESPSP
jgi:hypothetical protein